MGRGAELRRELELAELKLGEKLLRIRLKALETDSTLKVVKESLNKN